MQRLTNCLLGCLTASLLAGCGGGSGEYKTADQLPQAAPHDDHHHGHGAEGPHHGSLIELGEDEFHAELVVDGKTHTIRLYLLGADAKSPATTAATEVTVTPEEGAPLVLKAAADQPEGEISLFELTDEKAVHEIAEAGYIHGSLAIRVGEKDFNAAIDAHFHGDHAHP